MFDKILIANRGEIACRVARTARRMGIRTVAVYSDADADALHVAACDEAFRLGPPPPRESYLDGNAILAIAKQSGAKAIHPGYGFLSENEAFATACGRAGVVFIGPPPAAIAAMGSKSAAKRIMEAAKVPLVPGYHGDDQDAKLLAKEAAKIGYPVLIKATAGGGGKGMKVVSVRRRIRGGARVRAARGEVLIRRRARAGRKIPDGAASHRDPGVRGHAGQCRVSVRARLLGAAPPPEGARGSAGAGDEGGASPRDGRGGGCRRARNRLCRRGNRRVHRRRHVRARRGVLLHGDEHPAPGRASGDRDDHRPRSRRMAAARRRRRATSEAAGRACDRRTCPRGANLRGRSGARVPALDRHARPSARASHERIGPRRHGRARGRRDIAVLRPDDRQARRPRRGSRGRAAPHVRGAGGIRDRRRVDQHRAAATDRRARRVRVGPRRHRPHRAKPRGTVPADHAGAGVSAPGGGACRGRRDDPAAGGFCADHERSAFAMECRRSVVARQRFPRDRAPVRGGRCDVRPLVAPRRRELARGPSFRSGDCALVRARRPARDRQRRRRAHGHRRPAGGNASRRSAAARTGACGSSTRSRMPARWRCTAGT